MRIGEADTLLGQLIDVWRGDFRSRVVATDVAITQVVGEYQYDMRILQLGECACREKEQNKGQMFEVFQLEQYRGYD